MKAVDRNTAGAPAPLMVAAAFAAIYLIWGSTYLAIKYAIESVPPFLMTGARFLVAGAALYGWSALRPAPGLPAPASARTNLRAWREAFVVGALLIVGGTALVGWAELSVPSGITSLILATTPLWMVVLEGLSSGRAPAPRVLAGVVVGLGGLAILIWPSLMSPGSGIDLLGVAALAAAALTWSAGALYSRRVPLPGSAARATGMQMLAGGVLSLVLGIAFGEHRSLSVGAITPASLAAIGYLVIAGALVGFSAYLWLMRVSTPSRVATHAYVNPVVAVLLGWAVLGESVTARTGIAMAVIVVAVVLIVSAPRSAKPAGAGNTVPSRSRGTRRLTEHAA